MEQGLQQKESSTKKSPPPVALSCWPAFADMSSPAVIFPKAPISKASAAPASATSPSVRELEAVPMPVRRPGPTWTNLEVAAHREGAARLRARLQAVAVAPGPQNQIGPAADCLRLEPQVDDRLIEVPARTPPFISRVSPLWVGPVGKGRALRSRPSAEGSPRDGATSFTSLPPESLPVGSPSGGLLTSSPALTGGEFKSSISPNHEDRHLAVRMSLGTFPPVQTAQCP